jgi:hypothetical protein
MENGNKDQRGSDHEVLYLDYEYEHVELGLIPQQRVAAEQDFVLQQFVDKLGNGHGGFVSYILSLLKN